MKDERKEDPRVYLAVERTFLAWVRTALALMGFGFVVARFGLFLREIAQVHQPYKGSFSLPIGIALIVLGIIVSLSATLRYRRYIRSIDEGRFRAAFGSGFDLMIAVFLALIGTAMAVYLAGI